MSRERHSITIIGAGKLAWSLTPALKQAGYNVTFIISRNIDHAKKLGDKNSVKGYSDSLTGIPYNSDIILLTLPDDQLKVTADKLSGILPDLGGKLFVHFSGACSIDVLKTLQDKGGSTGSLHIMQTFPSRRRINLKNSNAVIEFPDVRSKIILFRMAYDLGLNPFVIDSAKKTEYHLAGVFASNFLISNLYAAKKLFESTGAGTDFYSYMGPIIKQTISNVNKGGIEKAITGPVERGDLETVKKHLDGLKDDKILLQMYLVQSLNIVSLKKEQGEMTPAHYEIEKYIKKKYAGNL